jgi:hypothetical protein
MSTWSREKTPTEKGSPCPSCVLIHTRPFLNGILAPHREVTATTKREEVIDGGGTPFGLRDAMSALKVKDGDGILTPSSYALALKGAAHGPNPHLLSERPGNNCFSQRRVLVCVHIGVSYGSFRSVHLVERNHGKTYLDAMGFLQSTGPESGSHSDIRRRSYWVKRVYIDYGGYDISRK